MAATKCYRVFGLRVHSEIPLPELPSEQPDAEADVSITTGVAGPPASSAGLHVHDGAVVLAVPEIASYRIAGGTSIIVQAAPGAPERNVRLYLLGSAFGILLHQRGLLPLHANAVELGGRAVAFMGRSGVGKSTLAAWFHDNGYRAIADDVCVVGFDAGGAARVRPGLPRLRLWKEALEASGREPSRYPRSWEGDEEWDKFDVPLHGERQTEPELAAVYLLDRGEELRIDRLTGAEATQALIENTYRGRHVAAAGDPRAHWESCVRLVRQVPVMRLSRPWQLSRLDSDMPRLVRQVGAVLADGEQGNLG